MSNKASAEIVANLVENLLNKIDAVEAQKMELQNFINTLVPGIKSGEITADRLQVLENGDIRILPPVPTNGVVKDVVTDTSPLPDLKEGEKVKVGVNDNGS